MSQAAISITALAVVVITMLAELWVSRRNERILLTRGAVETPDPVYATMRWAYPAVFVLMAVEGVLRASGLGWWPIEGAGPGGWTSLGVLIFGAGKLLKYWAIATLGNRWTYRVFVLPGTPLVATGPYRWMRHPNYVGVAGELVGMALITGAWTIGPPSAAFFGWLLQQRIAAENRALGLS